MAARRKARKRALDYLYAADLRGETGVTALERAIEEGNGPHNAYTSVLVRGVVEHGERIDALISAHARDWTLARMPAIDRNVLRIAAYEVLYADDVPTAVAISEAVGLVSDLSTDDSPNFVNGVLDALGRAERADS